MERRNEKTKVKGATDRRMSHENVCYNMQRYLRDGDWIDLFYGEHQEKKIGYICRGSSVLLDRSKEGEPKFNVGTYYPLLGTVYSQEMYDADNGVETYCQKDQKKTQT